MDQEVSDRACNVERESSDAGPARAQRSYDEPSQAPLHRCVASNCPNKHQACFLLGHTLVGSLSRSAEGALLRLQRCWHTMAQARVQLGMISASMGPFRIRCRNLLNCTPKECFNTRAH